MFHSLRECGSAGVRECKKRFPDWHAHIYKRCGFLQDLNKLQGNF